MKRWLQFREPFAIDLRALAVFRITIAILIIADLINRFGTLEAHYTDNGLLPRGAFLEKFANMYYLSVHFVSGVWQVEGLLFLVAIAFALLLMVGYRTRLVTVISWLFLISLHNRNPMVLQGGDVLFRLLVFWGMFLPLGARYSIDEALCRNKTSDQSLLSMGTVALLLQGALVYICSASLKSGVEWWPEGSATYYALMIDQFTTPFGRWLLGHYELTRWLTYFVFFLEWGALFLLFLPVRWWQIRFMTTCALIAMHAGFGLSMELGLFPFFDFASLLVFIPTQVWDWLSKHAVQYRKALAPLFSDHYRLIVRERWNASLAKQLPVRDHVELKQTRLGMIFTTVSLAFVLAWNAANEPRFGWSFPDALRPVMWTLRIDQYWNMFSPYPLKSDGWYVIEGELIDKSPVDVYYGKLGKPTAEKPADVSKIYSTQRWRKYMMNIWQKDNSDYRLYYGRYLCRNWNSTHEGNQRLYTFDINFMEETSLPNYKVEKPEKVTIWRHRCFDQDRTALLSPETSNKRR